MYQQYFPTLPFRHSLKSLILSGLSLTVLMSISMSVSAQLPPDIAAATGTDGDYEVCDYTYAVHDEKLNDTQVVTISSSGVVPLPDGFHPGLDIEGLDVDSWGRVIGSSGDDGEQPGHLYEINPETGDIVWSIGDICFDFPGDTGITLAPGLEAATVCGKEVSAISFNPVDDTLWGWAEECGLITINPWTAAAELVLAYPDDGGVTCLTKNPRKVTPIVEDMTWDNKGEKIYYALKSEVWVFEPPPLALNEEAKNRMIANLGKNVEALEMFPEVDDKLLLNIHNSSSPLVLDVITGDSYPSDITVGEFKDIEAIGTCLGKPDEPKCILEDSGWIYVKDSINDGTGRSPEFPEETKVGNTYFEMYGFAVRMDKETVTVAINSRVPLGGVQYPTALIAFGDFVFDFDGKKYGIRFEAANDSLDSNAELGLYEITEFKSVSKANVGHRNFITYQHFVTNGGGNPSLGDMSIVGNGYFVDSDSIPTSIKTGTKVVNDGFVMLDADELATRGLDFADKLGIPASAYDPNNPYSESNPKPADELGEYTFGFRFNRQDDMEGTFKAFVFTECGNDGIVMDNEFPECL